MNNIKDNSLQSIMRTSILTAFPRIFTDIPYSGEMLTKALKKAYNQNFTFETDFFSSKMALELEARHKSLNRILNQYIDTCDNNVLIVELASGLTPRHLEYANSFYYEFDLQQVNIIKRQIYSELGFDFLNRTVYDVDLNVKENIDSALSDILKKIKFQKVIIISEGLFWYITKETIDTIINGFKLFFDDFVWLTADCPTNIISSEQYRHIISNSSNRDQLKPFKNTNDYFDFFDNYNLTVKNISMNELISSKDLYSAKLFNVDENEVRERLRTYTNMAIIKQK